MLQTDAVRPLVNHELDAAVLQAAVAIGLSLFAGFLHRRYRKPYFFWFAVGWFAYALRIGVISVFLVTQRNAWLYLHQVLTGWTALALLWAALSFSRQLQFRREYLAALLIPAAWSYAAIFLLDNFLLAAMVSVVLLSAVTAYTGWLFAGYWRRVRAPGAAVLAAAQLLWAVHHLDYPFLRARGAWVPWGYYLDIAFLLATAAGLTLLVLDDLRQGFGALASLSGLTIGDSVEGTIGAMLLRAMHLPATRGAAYFAAAGDQVSLVRGTGACAQWSGAELTPGVRAALGDVIRHRRPIVLHDEAGVASDQTYAYVAVMAVAGAGAPSGALVLVGDSRDPFAALDEGFLVTLGARLADALRTAALTQGLRERSDELARLSARTVRLHEEERRRLSRELHDETAQVFSAVRLQLGILQEQVGGESAAGVQRALDLVDDGMHSIRSVTESLRPIVLDELGLLPALRSLAHDVEARCGLSIHLSTSGILPRLSADAELVLYRALQESLSNIVRHAGAQSARVVLSARRDALTMEVEDDGHGPVAPAGEEHMGLAGMRERTTSLGGTMSFGPGPSGGTRVEVSLPLTAGGNA